MKPKEFIEVWIDAFNSADIVRLEKLYSENAVFEQAVLAKPLNGRKEIISLLKLDFSRAKMKCIKERVYECGDTAILQWRDPNGLKGCGFFQIKDNQIIHQKGYFDQLSFFKFQNLPLPDEYLGS